MKEKVIIIAPFAHVESCVGKLRIDRFIRWLAAANKMVVLIRAGETDQVLNKDYGLDIIIRDPLNIYNADLKKSPRKPNKLRRLIAFYILSPDLGIIWAKKVAKHKFINSFCQGATKILSSSPPESSHWLGSVLAKKFNAKLIIDLRNGWLDEPLKISLQYSPWQRWCEGLLEKKVLSHAKTIFVTSRSL